MPNIPDNCPSDAFDDKGFTDDQTEDLKIVDDIRSIIESLEVELYVYPKNDHEAFVLFHNSKLQRVDLAKWLASNIRNSDVKKAISEIIDMWCHNDTPLKDIVSKDCDKGSVNEIYMDIMDGKFEYEGD